VGCRLIRHASATIEPEMIFGIGAPMGISNRFLVHFFRCQPKNFQIARKVPFYDNSFA